MLRAWVLVALMYLVGAVVVGVVVPGWSWHELITEDPAGLIIFYVATCGLLFLDRNLARRILGGRDPEDPESSSASPSSGPNPESGR
jgi:F0F1-type ATP synthase assembly protein I